MIAKTGFVMAWNLCQGLRVRTEFVLPQRSCLDKAARTVYAVLLNHFYDMTAKTG